MHLWGGGGRHNFKLPPPLWQPEHGKHVDQESSMDRGVFLSMRCSTVLVLMLVPRSKAVDMVHMLSSASLLMMMLVQFWEAGTAPIMSCGTSPLSASVCVCARTHTLLEIPPFPPLPGYNGTN